MAGAATRIPVVLYPKYYWDQHTRAAVLAGSDPALLWWAGYTSTAFRGFTMALTESTVPVP